MEILLVLVVLAVIAAAAFMWYRSRNQGSAGLSGGGPALRGRRGAARASRVDPMADVVERHAMATDPQEAAEAELRLQAQANRVAADLHAQQASALESEAERGGGLRARGSAMPADAYGGAAPVDAYGQPAPVDEYGRPLPADGYDRPVAGDGYGQPVYDADGRPVYVDGQPVVQDGTAVDESGRPVVADDGAAYYDEQGRPVYPEDRPRY
jgi:hypothetical protein